MKTCSCCGKEKPVNEFQVRRASSDGRTASCKECLQERDRKRAKNPNRVAAREVYRGTEAYKASHNAATRRWSTAKRIQRKAHIAVNSAMRCGRLEKKPCAICGDVEVEAHHQDYSAPLDVVWLCNKHHVQLHVEHNEMMRQLQGQQSSSTKEHE